MDKKFQQVQCWQQDLWGHPHEGVHPAGDPRPDGAALSLQDIEIDAGLYTILSSSESNILGSSEQGGQYQPTWHKFFWHICEIKLKVVLK